MEKLINVNDITFTDDRGDYDLSCCGYSLDYKSNLTKEVSDEMTMLYKDTQQSIYDIVKDIIELIIVDTKQISIEQYLDGIVDVIANRNAFEIDMNSVIQHFQVTEMDIDLARM